MNPGTLVHLLMARRMLFSSPGGREWTFTDTRVMHNYYKTSG